jgi:inner membrane protein
MDNLTHSLVAFMLSRAGFKRWCPHATALLILSANIADIDFVGAPAGDLKILEWHRGPTHSVFFSPLVALAPLALLALFTRRMPWRRAYIVSWIGVASHCLIDWTNIYGARLLSPLDEGWYALSINSVADLWIWLILIVAGGWMLLSRLVTAEIGATQASGRAVAVAALLAVFAFDFGRYILHERARNVLDARLYSGEAPLRVDALPTIANPFFWHGIVETESAYLLLDVNLLDAQFDPTAARRFYKPELSGAMKLAEQTEPFRKFLWFSKFPMWRSGPAGPSEPEGASEVQVFDLRFALPGENAFAATAIVDARDRIIRSWFQYEAPGTSPRFR